MQEEKQKAILVGLNNTRKKENTDIEASMDELNELAKAAGAEVLTIIIQNRPSVNPAYFIGKGKVNEIKQLCEAFDANMVIFNDELSGSQIRNLEDILDVNVIDRTVLILDILLREQAQKRVNFR